MAQEHINTESDLEFENVDNSVESCPNCGADLEGVLACDNCGAMLSSSDEFGGFEGEEDYSDGY
tara:strand:- start:388 stop:579 length:192 start_codon:yes stop_codon:yes gene_type:complete